MTPHTYPGCGRPLTPSEGMCSDCLARRMRISAGYHREQKRKREIADAMRRREQFFIARKDITND